MFTCIHIRLLQIAEMSVQIPAGFELHERLQKTFCQSRQKDVQANAIDWATAEALAFGSLLLDGKNVRLCGQVNATIVSSRVLWHSPMH